MTESQCKSVAAGRPEVIFRDLSTSIRSGFLKPGQQLPTELELARTYSLSRDSVRRGLMRLRDDGLIIKRHGSGSYVAGENSVGGSVSKTSRSLFVYNMDRFANMIPWFEEGIRNGLIERAASIGLEFFESPRFEGRKPSLPIDNLLGVIVFVAGSTNPSEVLAELPPTVHKVLLNRRSDDPKVPSIYIDHAYGTYEATSFLLRLGHRRIAMIYNIAPNPTYQQRVEGFRQAFSDREVPLDDSMLVPEPSTSAPDYADWPQILRGVLRRQPRPTALLMMNNGRALHIIDLIQGENLNVPDDISLILSDDYSILSTSKPTVSAIRSPVEQMGKLAVNMLVELNKGTKPNPMHARLRPELMIRGSVGLPKSSNNS